MELSYSQMTIKELEIEANNALNQEELAEFRKLKAKIILAELKSRITQSEVIKES